MRNGTTLAAVLVIYRRCVVDDAAVGAALLDNNKKKENNYEYTPRQQMSKGISAMNVSLDNGIVNLLLLLVLVAPYYPGSEMRRGLGREISRAAHA